MYNVGTQYSTSNGSGYRYDPIWPNSEAWKPSGNFQTISYNLLEFVLGCINSIFVNTGIIFNIEVSREIGVGEKVKISFGKDSYYSEVEFIVSDAYMCTGEYITPKDAIDKLREEVKWIESQLQ